MATIIIIIKYNNENKSLRLISSGCNPFSRRISARMAVGHRDGPCQRLNSVRGHLLPKEKPALARASVCARDGSPSALGPGDHRGSARGLMSKQARPSRHLLLHSTLGKAVASKGFSSPYIILKFNLIPDLRRHDNIMKHLILGSMFLLKITLLGQFARRERGLQISMK